MNRKILLVVLALSFVLMSLNLSVLAQEDQPEVIYPLPSLPPPSSTADQAIVILSATEGGTTNPAPGTRYYWNNTQIKLTAVPQEGYKFGYWAISGGYTPGHSMPPLISAIPVEVDGEVYIPPPRPPVQSTYDSLVATQNPLIVLCGYGYTFEYKAVFAPTTPTGSERVDAVVVVKDNVGGTTAPGPGTYTFADGSSLTLTAEPGSGQVFQYWVATGSGVSGHGENTVILDNPLTILCGVGYSYDYLPVFAPEGTTSQGGVSTEILYIVIGVLAVVAAIAVAAALMYRSKK